MRKLLKLPGRHHERHAVEALLQLVVRGVDLVFDPFLLVLLVPAVLVHLRNDLQVFGMIQIEENLDRSSATPHHDRLATDDGRERGEALLPVEQESRVRVRIQILVDRELLQRHVLVGLPHEDRAGRVLAIERIEKVANSSRTPHVSALHLRQTQLTTLDHPDQFRD